MHWGQIVQQCVVLLQKQKTKQNPQPVRVNLPPKSPVVCLFVYLFSPGVEQTRVTQCHDLILHLFFPLSVCLHEENMVCVCVCVCVCVSS